MVRQRLQELLQELHGELQDSDALDDAARRQLRALADEIETAVGEESLADTALGRIEAATVEFESEHPRVAGILGNIADTLSRLGI